MPDDSCVIRIAPFGVTINGTPLNKAEPVGWFHALLGKPTRVLPAGPPAPVGHRNNQFHFYDQLGIRLNEHHFTFQIRELTVVLNTIEAIQPTAKPYTGILEIGGVQIGAGDFESVLDETGISFVSTLHVWSADVQSAETDGRINISIDTKGRKLPTGRRSKKRELVSVSISLEHDPWDEKYRGLD